MESDVPVPTAAQDDPITLVWAPRPLTETNGRVGQLRMPESIARPLIDAGYVQEWFKTDGRDLQYVDLDSELPYALKPSAITASVSENPPGVFTVTFGGTADGVNALVSFRVRNDADLWIVKSQYGQQAGTDPAVAAAMFAGELSRVGADVLTITHDANAVTLQGKPGTVVSAVEVALGIRGDAAPAPAPSPEPSPPPPPAPAPSDPSEPPCPAPAPAPTVRATRAAK